jgi:hypothetical protein
MEHLRWISAWGVSGPTRWRALLSSEKALCRAALYRVLGAALVAFHAGASLAGTMMFFEPGPQLGPQQACVAATVKAGDTLENLDGDRLTVRSVSGKLASHFSACANAEQPFLAEVALSESPDFRSGFALDLPAAFAQMPLSDTQRFELCRMRAQSSQGHIWLSAYSWDRRKVPDIDAFAAEQKRVQTLRGDITQTATERLTIQGVPALRWNTEHRPHSIVPNTFAVTTVMIGDSEVVVLTVTGITRKLSDSRGELVQVAEGAHGLTKQMPGSPSAP